MDQTPSLPFEIFSLADLRPDRMEACRHQHRQTHFEIIWVQDGAGLHKVDDLSCPLVPGSVYCAIPGQDHELIIHPGTKGYLFSFEDGFLRQEMDEYDAFHGVSLRRLMRQYFEMRIDENTGEDMADMLILMLKENRKYGLRRKEILAGYLKIFMMLFRQQLEATSPILQQRTRDSLANAFFSLLENHFREEKSVSHYAHKLFVTPNYLNQIIKTTTGYPTKYHIQQRLLHEAKRVVHYRSASLKEIAYDLGFADSSHFSKFFKNVSGMSFSVFKKHSVSVLYQDPHSPSPAALS